MADDRDLATAITDAARGIIGAVERTGDRVERLEDRVAAVERGVDAAREASDRAATASTLQRAELRQLTDATQALIERRERTPVVVAAVPRTRFRWPLVVFGAVGALLAVAGVVAGLYVACQGAPPGHSWVEQRPKPPCKTPCKQPPRRPASDLGTDPTDRAVDPLDLPAEEGRVGCEQQGGLPNWQRTPGCRAPEAEPTPEY